MSETIANGTRREIDGRPSVYYDGYWIKWYDPPGTPRRPVPASSRP